MTRKTFRSAIGNPCCAGGNSGGASSDPVNEGVDKAIVQILALAPAPNAYPHPGRTYEHGLTIPFPNLGIPNPPQPHAWFCDMAGTISHPDKGTKNYYTDTWGGSRGFLVERSPVLLQSDITISWNLGGEAFLTHGGTANYADFIPGTFNPFTRTFSYTYYFHMTPASGRTTDHYSCPWPIAMQKRVDLTPMIQGSPVTLDEVASGHAVALAPSRTGTLMRPDRYGQWSPTYEYPETFGTSEFEFGGTSYRVLGWEAAYRGPLAAGVGDHTYKMQYYNTLLPGWQDVFEITRTHQGSRPYQVRYNCGATPDNKRELWWDGTITFEYNGSETYRLSDV